MATTLAAMANDLGLPARVEAAGDSPVVLIGSTDIPAPLLLLGHSDTVLPAQAPRREADRILATGATDMKGGLAVFFGAVAALRRAGRTWPRDLLLVVVPDEEVGGPISVATTREYGARARELWVLEPGGLVNGQESLVVGRRGLLDWSVQLSGRGSHAGSNFWEGRSALLAAADLALAIAALSQPGRGTTANPARLVASDRSALDPPTTLATLLGTSQQVNVVPDHAILDGEIRFFATRDGLAARTALEAEVARVGRDHQVGADLTLGELVPSLEAIPERLERAQEVVELARARGFELVLETERGGVSFPNFLPSHAAIPVLDGLGPVGGGMHTREEYVEVASLRRRVALLADLLVMG
jgi:glutamate carboxypeptidase